MKGSAGHPLSPSCFIGLNCATIGANRTYTMIVEVEIATIAKQVSSGGSKKPASHDRLSKSDSTTEIPPENGIGSLAGATMDRCLPARPTPSWLKTPARASTHLVYGGLYGLRFKPINIEETWNLESPHQWGETYLSLASDRDLRYAD